MVLCVLPKPPKKLFGVSFGYTQCVVFLNLDILIIVLCHCCSLVLLVSNIIMFIVLLCTFPGWYTSHSCHKRHVPHPSVSHHWVVIAMSSAYWGLWDLVHYVMSFPLRVFHDL